MTRNSFIVIISIVFFNRMSIPVLQAGLGVNFLMDR